MANYSSNMDSLTRTGTQMIPRQRLLPALKVTMPTAGLAITDRVRGEDKSPAPKLDVPPQNLPFQGASAATDVLDKDARRLLICVGADMIKTKNICRPANTVDVGDPMNQQL